MSFDVGGSAGPFGAFFSIVVALLLVAGWVILAGSRFTQGGVVERPERVPQLYGYTVCLIGLIMTITSVLSLVEAALTMGDPVHNSSSEWSAWEPSVSSFEAFRATYDQSREFRLGPTDPRPAPVAEEELRQRYEGLRADRIARTRIMAQRSLLTSILSLLIGVGLFAYHWRWLRQRGLRVPVAAPVPVGGALD